MGIEEKGDNGLHLQMALIVEEAIEKALAERDSPLSIGDYEIFAFAMVAAEQLTDKFDVRPRPSHYFNQPAYHACPPGPWSGGFSHFASACRIDGV